MPHVLRTASGEIASLHREPVPGSDPLPADHPEVRAFLGTDGGGFESLDAGFIRVLEDVVDVLVARNLIRVTDLPAEAQRKLFDRKGYRDGLRRNALRLFGDAPAAGQGEAGVFVPSRDTL